MVALATVGFTEVIKNLVQKGGRRLWTLTTILVGVVMTIVAFYCPGVVLYGIVGVSGATIFYDTIYKAFGKIFENFSVNVEPKKEEKADE